MLYKCELNYWWINSSNFESQTSVFLRSQPGNNLSASLLAQKLKFLHTPKAFCLCQHLDSLCTYPTSAHPLAAYIQLPVAWRVTHSATALSIGPQPPICTPRLTVPSSLLVPRLWLHTHTIKCWSPAPLSPTCLHSNSRPVPAWPNHRILCYPVG